MIIKLHNVQLHHHHGVQLQMCVLYCTVQVDLVTMLWSWHSIVQLVTPTWFLLLSIQCQCCSLSLSLMSYAMTTYSLYPCLLSCVSVAHSAPHWNGFAKYFGLWLPVRGCTVHSALHWSSLASVTIFILAQRKHELAELLLLSRAIFSSPIMACIPVGLYSWRSVAASNVSPAAQK